MLDVVEGLGRIVLDLRDFSETALRATRAVLRRVRPTSTVSSSVTSTMRCLTLGWIFASTGGAKARAHVDRIGPQRQRGDQAAPVGYPARCDHRHIERIDRRGQQHDQPDIVLAGMPGTFEAVDADHIDALATAETEWRTEVHLWITLTPLSLKRGRWSVGARPAVSTILIPEVMIASRYSS